MKSNVKFLAIFALLLGSVELLHARLGVGGGVGVGRPGVGVGRAGVGVGRAGVGVGRPGVGVGRAGVGVGRPGVGVGRAGVGVGVGRRAGYYEEGQGEQYEN